MIRFGPAGWSYKDWAGIVYPSPKPKGFDPLRYLAGFFDTIEVNSTFYHPAREEVARSWVERVAERQEFRFTAKLWRRFTHERKESWSAEEVGQVRATFDPIGEAGRLGAMLVQFPWSFRRTEENREWLEDVTSTFAEYPLVLEVRHSSWNEPEFFRELRERGIGFVNIDQPLFKNSIKPSAVATAPVGYIRVHGRNYKEWWRSASPTGKLRDAARAEERYDYLYSAEELEPWADRVKQLAAEPTTEDVYVVTNNHFRGKGITNAIMLQAMVEGEPVPAPPDLFDEYGEVLASYGHPGDPAAPQANP